MNTRDTQNMEMQSPQISNLTKALVAVQKELKSAHKNIQGYGYKGNAYRYADLAEVWRTCRELNTTNGLAISQTITVVEGNYYLIATLLHTSGEFIRSKCPLFFDKGKNAMQSFGSAITYARRYTIAALVGVDSDADDDGASTSVSVVPTSDTNTTLPDYTIPVGTYKGKTLRDLSRDQLSSEFRYWSGVAKTNGNNKAKGYVSSLKAYGSMLT